MLARTRSLVPAAARLARTVASHSAEPTPDVFPPPPEEDEWKPYMYLPPLGADRRGPQFEPLINVPPAEDPLLHFLASMIMTHGERAKARRVVSKTLLHIFTLTRAPPLPILRQAVLLASPAVKTQSQTHGAKTVFTPVALSEKQRTHYGILWLLAACRSRTGRRLEERLAREMIDIVQRTHDATLISPDKLDKHKFSGLLGHKHDQHKFAMINRGNVKVEPGKWVAPLSRPSVTPSLDEAFPPGPPSPDLDSNPA
ncbi:ribosomal protein S7 domain-containing protein [Mycena metata]|uniref:Ribosomal protein S7 domain-containing protein n=1 Tax=Mycena metata TaxID=1033252 RepID=A0AAD7J9V8_9AGAR|nr:ribosomal protein S7 domain-containing protein [Mycena metata]